MRTRGSSVRVSAYGLDFRVIEVRSPAETKGFFPLASVSRPALGPTERPVQWVPGVKRGRGVTLTTHPRIMPSSRMSRSYTSPTSLPWVCCWAALPFYLYDTSKASTYIRTSVQDSTQLSHYSSGRCEDCDFLSIF
jgi:hypothetical protein